MRFCTAIPAALAGVMLVGAAGAATVSVESVADATLYQDSAGATANGAGERMFVGLNGNGELRRGLVRFDVASAVPAFAWITAGTLTLNCSRSNATAAQVSVELHRVTASWGEGTSNAGDPGGSGTLATPGDATWIHRFYDTTPWTTPGGDFVPDLSSQADVLGTGGYNWPSSDAVVADLQGWLDQPAGNFGWLLTGSSAESVLNSAKRFDTRENADISTHPSLTIDFFLAGDANLDDRVDTLDFNALAANFGRQDSGVDFQHADFNRDGRVDTLDFNLLAANFGKQYPPDNRAAMETSNVPEPAAALAALALGSVLPRRRSGSGDGQRGTDH